MTKPEFLSAKQAAHELGVSLPTLYAYVSRGLVRSETTTGLKRHRRYNREDIDRLKERKELRRNPGKAAEQALHWGAPVLPSALTLIANGKFYYRGIDALELAERYSFEQVVQLLWTGELKKKDDSGWIDETVDLTPYRSLLDNNLSLSSIETFQVVLPVAEARDPAAFDLRPQAVLKIGARILKLFVLIATGTDKITDRGIAGTIQQAWAPGIQEAAGLFNIALILSADHELNISSFTARCVASAGSTPYAAVLAGLAAFQGTRHGGYTRRVEALLNEVKSIGNARKALISRLERGETIPGFGHRLYPEGDPRGRILMERLSQYSRSSQETQLAQEIASSALDLIGEYPTIDFGMVALSRALNLPPGSAITLFALGRTSGWLAHSIEQYATDELIRPRAKYIGKAIRG